MVTCTHSRYDQSKNDHPDIYNEFKAGKFVGQLSDREFSAMSLDQASNSYAYCIDLLLFIIFVYNLIVLT